MNFVALTPTLSQRERVGAPKRLFESPRPLGEGKGEGISCYDLARFKGFETVSQDPAPKSRLDS